MRTRISATVLSHEARAAAAAATTAATASPIVLPTIYQLLNSLGRQINVQFCPVQISEQAGGAIEINWVTV